MKELKNGELIEDLGLQPKELVKIGSTVYEYVGIVEKDNKVYDKIVPVFELPIESLS